MSASIVASSPFAAASRVAVAKRSPSTRASAVRLGRPVVASASVARRAAATSASPASSSPVFAARARGRGRGRVVARAAAAFAAADAAGAGAAAPAPSSDAKPSLLDVARAMSFYLVSFTLALPLFAAMMVMFPFTYVSDKYRRYALSFVNDVWATISTLPFVKVRVVGREHLPAVDAPAVYVANHASYMDIYSLFHLRRPFKFISKVSNFIIPIIGWSMYMTGHIALKRTDRKSQMKTLKDCRELLQNDCPVLFFPEGTRSKDGVMADFKKGAFSVAAKERAPVVPVTIVGASQRMRSGREWAMSAGEIVLVVHPPIASDDAQELCDESYKVIKESLVAYS